MAQQFGPTDGEPNEEQVMALWQWLGEQGHVDPNVDIDSQGPITVTVPEGEEQMEQKNGREQ